MSGDDAEACGRCAMTTAVGAAGGADADRDPFAGERIEVAEDDLRAVARPAVWLASARRRLDDLASQIVYGR
ncbi:MAG: hypothetical protein ABEJ31_10090 [Haloarculaceae archaeon]